MELTDAELVSLFIGGCVLVGTCVVETPIILSVRLICFVIGVVLLAFAIASMVTN